MPAPSKILQKDQITGLVLAGGASSRLAGYPLGKGLLLLNGQPLVAHVVNRLKPQVGTLAISANRHLNHYEALGYPVWTDIKEDGWEEYPGPLTGMLTGLKHLQTTWLLTAPCDSPLLPLDFAEKLYSKALQTNAEVVIACTQTPEGMKDHPVFALIHRSLKSNLQDYLLSGNRKIILWMKQHAFERVIFDHQQAFMVNINTMKEFDHLNELLQK